ncbi:MAG: PLP-dependent aminotransferase family protein [Dehalococcoidia bacterium]|nr:PLP-dependent aminotransferase family protein [Dehalococcoidia bacterium]
MDEGVHLMDYSGLFSSNTPLPVDMPAGLQADTKYVFSVTYADQGVFPTEGLIESLSKVIRNEGQTLSQYPPPQGHLGMRELIAGTLAGQRGAAGIDPQSIFLSSGAGGAIGAILDVFIDPGDVVFVEEFSYLGTMRMLLERGADVRHVPTDVNGMDTDALDRMIGEAIAEGATPKMIYTISVYQNPMGVTLSHDRRRHMVQIAQKHGVPIFENESYADFRIDGDPLPPAMLGMDDQDSVMYVSAYTKLIGCGLRLGYGVVPAPVLDSLKTVRFGGVPSHLAAMAVYQYLTDNREEYISDVAGSLRASRDSMLGALEKHFPSNTSWSRPDGGMMIWVELPEGADTMAALPAAVEADVKYNPGPVFRAERDRANYLRLTYSHNSPEEIGDGIEILAGVFQREGLFG